MGGIAGNDDNRKQNHCEIEKRRRDKMNHYITELASVIPAFNNNQSRLDKLTVLRMAVQHVKSLRSSLCSFSSFHLRPSFLSSGNLLKNLILQMASQEAQDNLFMVVTCDRGKVLFVSKSSKDILNQDQSELVGQSLFDILHKDDVAKVKEQISYFNLMPKEMLVDSKTLQPIKSNQRKSFIQLQNQSTSNTLQPGSRRSFFCRMKSGRIWPPSDPHSSSKSQSSPSSSPTSSSSSCKESKREATNYQSNTTDSSASQQRKHHKHEQQTKTKISQKCQEAIQNSLQHQRENRSEKNKQTSSGGKSNKSYKRNERHLSHNYHNQQERQRSCDFEKSNSVYSSGSGKSSSGGGGGGGGQSSSGSDSSSGISSAPTSSGSGGNSSDNSRTSSGGAGGGGGGSIQCCAKMTKRSRDRERSRDRGSTAAAKIVDKGNHHGKSSKTKHIAAHGNHHHNQRDNSSRGLSLSSADGSDDRKQSGARANSGSHVNGGDRASVRRSSGDSGTAADRNVGDNGGLNSHGSSVSGHSSETASSQDDCGKDGDRGSSTTTNKLLPLSSSSVLSSASPQSSSLSPLSTSSGGDKNVDKNNAERNKQTEEGGATESLGAKQASSRESSMSTTGGNSNDDSGHSSSGSGGTSSISLGSSNGSHNGGGGGLYNRKQWRYVVMHCSGYLKSITLRNDEYDSDDFDEKTGGNSSDDSDDDEHVDTQNKEDSNFRTVNCLVAVCRRSVLDRDLKPDRPLTFTCRYSMEGKFTFVDQRTTVALGYTPQQLMGTSHYAYCHKDSVNTFKECHRQCILKPDTVSSDIYQFKRANGQHLWLQTSLKSFRNPWTKFIDYIVANHTTAEGNDPRYNEGCVPTKFNQDMTCEANEQSSSPASSSSLPSEECKKSASPSSSSIGSSYSMDSYASGGSIQALLNQIDRVKSGGLKHSLEFPKKRSSTCHSHRHNHHTQHNHRNGDAAGSSGGSSARKSTDDSGNYSDVQSCSSISSQNSGSMTSSAGFTQTVNNFVNRASNVSLAETQTSTARNETKTTTETEVKQRPPPSAVQQTKPPAKSVVNTNDTTGVTCRMDSTGSYQFGSHKQDQKEVSARAEADICGQQQDFERQQTVCRPVICAPAAPVQNQQICAHAQQNFASVATNSVPSNPSNARHEQQYISAGPCKTGMGGPRMVTARVNRAPSINSTSAIKPLQRPYQYSYRAPQIKSGQTSAETVSPARETSWVTQASNYTGTSAGGAGNGSAQVVKTQVRDDHIVSGKEEPGGQQQHAYVMQQQQQMTAVNVIQIPQTIQNQSNSDFNTHMAYQNTFPLQQVAPTYMSSAATVDARYATADASMGHSMSQVQDSTAARISMGGQQQASQQGQPPNDMGIPMIWNSSGSAYPDMMTTTSMHTSGQQQQQMSCHQVPAGALGGPSNMVGMDLVVSQTNQMDLGHHHSHCHQCAGHKCCVMNQQIMMPSNNSGDFNSMHLSSLAVDDLDESELLECLAACDPDSQMYNMQNNTYPQYNVYRGQ